MKYLMFIVLLICSLMAQAGPVQDWNNEFMRLNGIHPSKMTNDENMMSYFKTISKNGGYKLPVAVTTTPVTTIPPVVLPPTPTQNATSKQLIKTIIDAATALDKL